MNKQIMFAVIPARIDKNAKIPYLLLLLQDDNNIIFDRSID
jgi:hypothetical protein